MDVSVTAWSPTDMLKHDVTRLRLVLYAPILGVLLRVIKHKFGPSELVSYWPARHHLITGDRHFLIVLYHVNKAVSQFLLSGGIQTYNWPFITCTFLKIVLKQAVKLLKIFITRLRSICVYLKLIISVCKFVRQRHVVTVTLYYCLKSVCAQRFLYFSSFQVGGWGSTSIRTAVPLHFLPFALWWSRWILWTGILCKLYNK